MNAIATEVIVILLLILMNGVFAMAELALVSVRRARLRQLSAGGDARASIALELVESPNRLLSTVQVGITLVGVLAGAFAGATLARALAEVLRTVPALASSAEATALGLVVLVLTVTTVVLGELVPKRFALNHPLPLALFFARPMNRLSRLAAPVVSLLSVLTEAVLRVFGLRPRQEPPVSAEEVRSLVAQGQESGVFGASERNLLERVLTLGSRRIGDMMTPRARIVWLNAADPDEVNWRKILVGGHSWFPVHEGRRDHVIGLVSVKALWAGHALGPAAPLRTLVVQPPIVPTSMNVLKLLETFREKRHHMALVADEFGTVQGLVTLVDVFEEIAGDFPGFDVPLSQRAVQRADGSWLMDAGLELCEFKKLLGLSDLPDEESEEFQTLGGFLLAQFQRIPAESDYFDCNGFRFEVADMDRHRVDKVLIQRLPPPASSP